MSTDQCTSYSLVEAVKKGILPEEMQDMLCGPLCHARFAISTFEYIAVLPTSVMTFFNRWLTTAQRIVFLWTRKHGLSGSNLRVLESLVKFCLQFYFKIYFVRHLIVDAPYHVLTHEGWEGVW